MSKGEVVKERREGEGVRLRGEDLKSIDNNVYS